MDSNKQRNAPPQNMPPLGRRPGGPMGSRIKSEKPKNTKKALARLLKYIGKSKMLVILLTVLVQDNRRGVLFMDEPEVSLHVEWQQRLIGLIRELNPNVQIILTTHSPAMIMDGWEDAVTEVSDITV